MKHKIDLDGKSVIIKTKLDITMCNIFGHFLDARAFVQQGQFE